MKGKRTMDELELNSAKNLLNENFPSLKWIVPGILPTGLTILSSKPKQGKSFLALSLALNASSGRIFLNHFDTNISKCLYVSCEDSKRMIQRRLRRMIGENKSILKADNFFIEETSTKGIMKNINMLAYFIGKYQLDLIIVDTLGKFIEPPESGGNQYLNEYKMMGEYQNFAHENDVCLLFIHHNRKMSSSNSIDTILGTNGISGGADTLWILNEYGARMKLDIYGKEVESKSLLVEFNKSNFEWSMIDEISESDLSPEQEELLNILRIHNKPLKLNEIAKLSGKQPNNVCTLLKKLVLKGYVSTPKTGHYKAIK